MTAVRGRANWAFEQRARQNTRLRSPQSVYSWEGHNLVALQQKLKRASECATATQREKHEAMPVKAGPVCSRQPARATHAHEVVVHQHSRRAADQQISWAIDELVGARSVAAHRLVAGANPSAE